MKFILIYGPEATGKLTVAKLLAERTGFHLFHNHVSIDVARTLFDFNTREFSDLSWDVRITVFEHASRANLPGLIFTWAYSHPDFLPYFERMKQVIEKHGGEILYVFLSCSTEELQRRVVQADRGEAGKINTTEALARQLQRKNHRVIPGTPTLEIDNTHLSPEEVVDKIIAHYLL